MNNIVIMYTIIYIIFIEFFFFNIIIYDYINKLLLL